MTKKQIDEMHWKIKAIEHFANRGGAITKDGRVESRYYTTRKIDRMKLFPKKYSNYRTIERMCDKGDLDWAYLGMKDEPTKMVHANEIIRFLANYFKNEDTKNNQS